MADDKKSKEAPEKPISETKAVGAKAVGAKGVEAKAETAPTSESKPDAAPRKQGMGEGQKPVSKAYKDNWNDILEKRKSDRARKKRKALPRGVSRAFATGALEGSTVQ